MKPKQIWANLAVKDVKRTTQFYTALGFKPTGQNNESMAGFNFGDNNFIVMFFTVPHLEKSMGGKAADLSNGNEIMFSLSAANPEQADQWAEEVRKAGGTIFSEPQTFGDNWYGFGFADPDGHKWNVFHMAGLE